MRRRPLAAVAALAALALALTGCTTANEVDLLFHATTSNSGHSWTAGAWCKDDGTDGGRFDIEQVILVRTGTTVTVTFTLRKLPRFRTSASAIVSFHETTGGRAGFPDPVPRSGRLTMRLVAHDAPWSATVLDGVSHRRTTIAALPTVDEAARTISTVFPADAVGIEDARWTWTADTVLDGMHQDRCSGAGVAGPVS